ncbi:MAG: glycosyltransferase family 4 protein [Gammaproteobacteria bacterium]|nr:glycosyltransferase family 4 protein [Gammaproteobacteria bacterium]MDH5799509.1 glycosyltransferase family 4 protein [Gammaproteobacteria bacterium]
MRIAYLCMDPGIPVFGNKGCSVHVQEVIRAFIKLGATVDLFTVRSGGSPPPGLEQVKLQQLPLPPKTDSAAREQAAMALNQDLFNLLEALNNYDLIYERYSLWSYAGMDFAAQNNIPGILEVNAPLVEEQAKHRDLIHKAQAETITSTLLQTAAAIICVSQEIANYIINKEGCTTLSKLHVIPNGINADRFPNAGTDKKPQAPFVVGFVGTLKPWHGLPGLIEAFAAFHRQQPNTRLMVVGDGPQKSEIQELCTKYNIEAAVDLIGAVAPQEIPAKLASMDIAVAPYPNLSEFYFSPLKVYEYMAAGLAVIASEIGQLKQLIIPGKNGLLCTPGNVDSLLQSLLRLYNDEKLRQTLGAEARKTVIQNYTWDKVADRIIQIAQRMEDKSGLKRGTA